MENKLHSFFMINAPNRVSRFVKIQFLRRYTWPFTIYSTISLCKSSLRPEIYFFLLDAPHSKVMTLYYGNNKELLSWRAPCSRHVIKPSVIRLISFERGILSLVFICSTTDSRSEEIKAHFNPFSTCPFWYLGRFPLSKLLIRWMYWIYKAMKGMERRITAERRLSQRNRAPN